VQTLRDESWVEVMVVGQRDDGSVFMAVGSGTDEWPVDAGLVRELALAARDRVPFPTELEGWVDVTPAPVEPLVPEPVWYFHSANPDPNLAGRIVAGTVDPRIQLVKGPGRCQLVSVGAVPAALCWRDLGGALTWQIADGVAATVSSYDYPADELMAVAESMVLMSPDDPRFPPEE
jgi:hypothetical protein